MKTLQKKLSPFQGFLPAILSTTEHIYTDISANSALISVEYSYLHVPFPRGVLCEYGIIWIKTEGAFH